MNQAEQALADARRAGIDLDLIDTTLRQSVAERWRQHDAAANLATRLERSKKARDAGLQYAPSAAR